MGVNLSYEGTVTGTAASDRKRQNRQFNFGTVGSTTGSYWDDHTRQSASWGTGQAVAHRAGATSD